MKASYIAVCSVLVLILLAYEAQVSSTALTCNPKELRPCMGAITSNTTPSKLCCSKIKEQKFCLCQYVKNPKLKKYITSPDFKEVAATCGVPVPKC